MFSYDAQGFRTSNQLEVRDLPAFLCATQPSSGTYTFQTEDMHESVGGLPPPPSLNSDLPPNFNTTHHRHSQFSQVVGINPATTFSHFDPFMENSYSEIPPIQAGNEPPHIQDMKGMEYIGGNPQTGYQYHKNGGDALYDSTTQEHGRQQTSNHKENFTALTVPGAQSSPKRMDDTLELDYYSEVRKPCFCNKQVTIHVVIMALAGIAYLVIGGVAGFYIGKKCKFL